MSICQTVVDGHWCHQWKTDFAILLRAAILWALGHGSRAESLKKNDELHQVGSIKDALFHCFQKVLGGHEHYSRRGTSAAGLEDSVKMFSSSKA